MPVTPVDKQSPGLPVEPGLFYPRSSRASLVGRHKTGRKIGDIAKSRVLKNGYTITHIYDELNGKGNADRQSMPNCKPE